METAPSVSPACQCSSLLFFFLLLLRVVARFPDILSARRSRHVRCGSPRGNRQSRSASSEKRCSRRAVDPTDSRSVRGCASGRRPCGVKAAIRAGPRKQPCATSALSGVRRRCGEARACLEPLRSRLEEGRWLLIRPCPAAHAGSRRPGARTPARSCCCCPRRRRDRGLAFTRARSGTTTRCGPGFFFLLEDADVVRSPSGFGARAKAGRPDAPSATGTALRRTSAKGSVDYAYQVHGIGAGGGRIQDESAKAGGEGLRRCGAGGTRTSSRASEARGGQGDLVEARPASALSERAHDPPSGAGAERRFVFLLSGASISSSLVLLKPREEPALECAC